LTVLRLTGGGGKIWIFGIAREVPQAIPIYQMMIVEVNLFKADKAILDCRPNLPDDDCSGLTQARLYLRVVGNSNNSQESEPQYGRVQKDPGQDTAKMESYFQVYI
jgi:hypothetical protein